MTHPHLDSVGTPGTPPEPRAFPTISFAPPSAAVKGQGVARRLPSLEGSVVADRVYRFALLFFALSK